MVTDCKAVVYPFRSSTGNAATGIVAAMVTKHHGKSAVTKIGSNTARRLYLKEHRLAHGVSAEVMGGRIGMERPSVHRLEKAKEPSKAKWQARWAAALEIEPEDLWRLPDAKPIESIDAMLRDKPDEIREMAADIVRRLVGGKG